MFGFIWHLPETSLPWHLRPQLHSSDTEMRGANVSYTWFYMQSTCSVLCEIQFPTHLRPAAYAKSIRSMRKMGKKQSAGKIFTHVKGVITPNRCVCPPAKSNPTEHKEQYKYKVMRCGVMAPFRERSLGPSEINFLWRQKGKRKTFAEKLKPRWGKLLAALATFTCRFRNKNIASCCHNPSNNQ